MSRTLLLRGCLLDDRSLWIGTATVSLRLRPHCPENQVNDADDDSESDQEPHGRCETAGKEGDHGSSTRSFNPALERCSSIHSQ